MNTKYNQSIIPPSNYTQVPNVAFDYWMPKLKPTSFVVLMTMCRKIFGWHKTTDTISKNQLIKATGLSKNSVQSAIVELEEVGLLIKHQTKTEYGWKPNTYSLNAEKPMDEIYSDDPDENLGGGRSKSDLGVGQNLTLQKKDPTKEKKEKDIKRKSPLPKKALPVWKNAHGSDSLVSLTTKEHMKLLEEFGVDILDDLIEKLNNYIGSSGKEYQSHYHTLKTWRRKDESSEKKTEKPARKGTKANFERVKDDWQPKDHLEELIKNGTI